MEWEVTLKLKVRQTWVLILALPLDVTRWLTDGVTYWPEPESARFG